MPKQGPGYERILDRLLQPLSKYLEPILGAAATVDAVQARCGVDPPNDSLTGPELPRLRTITKRTIKRLRDADYRRESALLAVEVDLIEAALRDETAETQYNVDGLLAALSDAGQFGPEADALKDYAMATDIRKKHTPAGIVLDQRRLVKFLSLHPTIRTRRPLGSDGKPRTNRLLVHVGDWYIHHDALKEWDTADGDSIEATPESEIAERIAAVRRKKQREK